MFSTSYFAKQNLVPNPISISAFPPKWYEGKEYRLLSPTKQMLRSYKQGSLTQPEYTTLFKEQLSLMSAKLIYRDLCDVHDSENFTLLCFEKPSDFCHRHLVREWLNKELNLKGKEFSFAPATGLFNL